MTETERRLATFRKAVIAARNVLHAANRGNGEGGARARIEARDMLDAAIGASYEMAKDQPK